MALPVNLKQRPSAWTKVCALVLLVSVTVQAQEPPASKAQLPATTPNVLSSGAIKPDAIYLRNAEGDLIFVPSQRYEDFAQYLRDRSVKDAPNLPPYAVDLLRCEITARNGFADLDLYLTAQVANPDVPVVQIPLAMSNMNIVAPPEIRGGQNSFVKLTSDGSYSWWIVPDESKTYELHIKAVVKLNVQAARTSLRLDLPQVTSQVRLTVPGPNQDIQLVGSGTEVLENEVASEASIANIRGQGGVINVVWKAPSSTVDTGALEVDSVSRLMVTDQSRAWKGSTLFKVQSFGPEQERQFVIKLPAGYRWIPSSSSLDESNMTLQPVISAGSEQEANSQPTILIARLRNPSQSTPTELSIDWERPAVGDAEFTLPLQGLEVEGVQRHESQFELECPQDYRVSWESVDASIIQQQSRSTTDGSRMIYVFRFARPPLMLDVSLRRVGPRIVVRPNYQIRIEPNRLELTALVELVSDPTQLNGLRFSMEDWEFDRLEPYPTNGTQIDVERDANGELIPNLTQANSPGTAVSIDASTTSRRVIRLTAHRAWDSALGADLKLQVPRISLTSLPNDRRSLDITKGFVVLTHANNLQVASGTLDLQGLIEEQRPPSAIAELFSSQATAKNLYYRMTATDAAGQWQGNLIRVPQQIYSTMDAAIKIGESQVDIEQVWRIQIANEPLRRMPILVDRRLLKSTRPATDTDLAILLNSKAVAWTEIPDSSVVGLVPAGVDLARWAMIEVVSSDMMGEANLVMKSRLPLPESDDEGLVLVNVPLAWPTLPGKPKELARTIQLTASELVECQVETKVASSSIIPSGRPVDIALPDNERDLACEVRKLRRVLLDPVQIDQAWLQTLASSSMIRDRFVVKFRSKEDRMRIDLPKSWDIASGGILLDGVAIEPLALESSSERVIEVDLASTDDAQVWHVVEMWSMRNRSSGRFRTMQALFPTIRGAGPAYPFLWQVIVPNHEHLVWSSNTLGAEYRWTWDIIGLSRKNIWNQSDLERKLGATVQQSSPEQTNQYVLSSLGDVANLQIQTAPRYLLWSPVCGVALLCFWVWCVWQPARGGLLFLASVAGLALLMMIATDLFIILAQTLIASLIVVTLFRLLQWTVDRRVRQRSIFAPRPTSVLRPSTVSMEAVPQSPSTRSLPNDSPPLQEASS